MSDDDEILAAQAGGARMCGAWPYIGTPTSPGQLTEAELDMHNRDFHGWPLQATRECAAIFGPDGSAKLYLPDPTRRERFALWVRSFWDGLLS